MSERQGRRINNSEEGGRKPWGWIVAGIVLLLLLLILVPFACSALTGGGSDQSGSGGEGQQDQANGSQGSGKDTSQAASENTNGASAESTGESTGQVEETDAETTGTMNVGSETISAKLPSFGGAEGDGTSVTVPGATVQGGAGWLVIRDGEGDDSAVLGHAPLTEGQNTDVVVELDEPVESGELYATVHADSPAGGKFTYPDGDPEIASGAGAASESFEYAVPSGKPASAEPLPGTGGPSAATVKSVAGVSFFLMGVGMIAWSKRRNERA